MASSCDTTGNFDIIVYLLHKWGLHGIVFNNVLQSNRQSTTLIQSQAGLKCNQYKRIYNHQENVIENGKSSKIPLAYRTLSNSLRLQYCALTCCVLRYCTTARPTDPDARVHISK